MNTIIKITLLIILSNSTLYASEYQRSASQASIDLAQQMFVVYYGRPADPGGLSYWSGVFDSTNDLTQALNAFGNSTEFTNSFGSLSNAELITNLYQQMYGRDPDSGGLAFYADRLTSGEATLATIGKQIADGSQGSDLSTISNRISVANTFTAEVELNGATYNSSNIADAQALIAAVDDTASSLTEGNNSATSYVSSMNDDAAIFTLTSAGGSKASAVYNWIEEKAGIIVNVFDGNKSEVPTSLWG